MRLPGRTSWSAGVCKGLVGPRNYKVEAGGNVFTHNRRQLLRVDSSPSHEIPDIEEHLTSQQDKSELSQDAAPVPNLSPHNTQHTSSSDTEHSVASPSQLRRSGRNRRPPDWITNYVPS